MYRRFRECFPKFSVHLFNQNGAASKLDFQLNNEYKSDEIFNSINKFLNAFKPLSKTNLNIHLKISWSENLLVFRNWKLFWFYLLKISFFSDFVWFSGKTFVVFLARMFMIGLSWFFSFFQLSSSIKITFLSLLR